MSRQLLPLQRSAPASAVSIGRRGAFASPGLLHMVSVEVRVGTRVITWFDQLKRYRSILTLSRFATLGLRNLPSSGVLKHSQDVQIREREARSCLPHRARAYI